MRHHQLDQRRVLASLQAHTRGDTSSWLPLRPQLQVAVDPIRWSQRARADQRWQKCIATQDADEQCIRHRAVVCPGSTHSHRPSE